MLIYILLASVFIMLVLVLFILMCIPACFLKAKTKMNAILKKTFWNGIIRSQMISFLKVAVTAKVQFVMWIHASEYQSLADKVTSSLMLSFLTLLIVGSAVILRRHNIIDEYGETLPIPEKYSIMTSNIHIKRSNLNIYFFSTFLLKRLLFAAIATCF